ncbi:MAG TPA: adenylate/guanylate cyclase domain-containing protein [Acidimicrobiia bacterium]
MSGTVRCGNCGHENPSDHRFCSNCGTALAGTASSPAPTAAATPVVERRVATVVFADLSGFTSMSGETDPEEVRALVDRCMSLLSEIVGRFGGTVDKFIGDAVLALWGVPVALEDHAERAVRAALEMQTCARTHAAEFGGLTLRIGVNTGELMFAPVGPEQQRQQTVIGDVVNIASRLQTSAPRGGILVGEETWRATRRAIHYEQVEPFMVKGRAAPLDAWLALEAVAATPTERMLSDVPMVGRERELEVLDELWAHVVDERQPHFAVVVGDPGIGKSRLCREFRRCVEANDVPVIVGRSSPYGETTPYGAFAEIVKQDAGIYDTDDAADALAKLEARVVALPWQGDVAEGVRALGVLTGLGSEGLANRAALVDAAQRFVEAAGCEQPVVFGFEDLHWADESLLDLVRDLARVRDVPVFILCTARTELLDEHAGFGRGLPAYSALALDSLTDDASEALTRELLRGHPVAPAVLERIGDAAGGNPLFLEELTTSVAEGSTDPTRGLPVSVVSIIAARFDALPARERRLLLNASVIGRTFWRSLLVRLDPGTDVDDALAALEAREFIRRDRTSELEGDDAYSFRHIALREVAYNTLPKAERRELHAEVAKFAEESYPPGSRMLAPILAHHLREAGDSDRAIGYFQQAAEQAEASWAKQEAVVFYNQMLELLPEGDSRIRGLRMKRALAMQAYNHIRFGDVVPPDDDDQAGKSNGVTSPPIS